MKYSKVAAVVAGSVMVMGAGAASAAPAFAAGGAALPASTLAGDLGRTTQTLQGGKSPVSSVTGTAGSLVKAKNDAPQKVLGTASHLTPMLGGVQLGGR